MFDVEAQLEEKGELIVRMDSGEEYELHNHNVDFADRNGGTVMRIQTADEVELADTEKVEAIRWHYDK